MTIKPPVEKTRSLLDEEAGIGLVFFRDEIKIFLISWFETRSRFVSSTSRASRRDREFVPSNLEFRDGDEILKKISCGRARYLVAKSHEIFRDRDISPCSIDSIPINRYIYTTLMVNDRSLSPVSYFHLIAWTIGFTITETQCYFKSS